MNNKINKELVAKLTLEISQRYDDIVKIFPKDNQHILKHLAASAIHLTMFMKDFYEITEGVSLGIDKNDENGFLKECGCEVFKDE